MTDDEANDTTQPRIPAPTTAGPHDADPTIAALRGNGLYTEHDMNAAARIAVVDLCELRSRAEDLAGVFAPLMGAPTLNDRSDELGRNLVAGRASLQRMVVLVDEIAELIGMEPLGEATADSGGDRYSEGFYDGVSRGIKRLLEVQGKWDPTIGSQAIATVFGELADEDSDAPRFTMSTTIGEVLELVAADVAGIIAADDSLERKVARIKSYLASAPVARVITSKVDTKLRKALMGEVA